MMMFGFSFCSVFPNSYLSWQGGERLGSFSRCEEGGGHGQCRCQWYHVQRISCMRGCGYQGPGTCRCLEETDGTAIQGLLNGTCFVFWGDQT